MTHTKGPWRVDGGYITADVLHDMDCIVEHVYGPDANAHLIAAAPELLEALRVLRKWMGPCWCDPEIDNAMRDADAAIAKAEGRAE